MFVFAMNHIRRQFSTAFRPVTSAETQIMLSNLKPIKKNRRQQLGRGGKRGKSSGRGNGGQKHHSGKLPPWFTGLYTSPLTEAIPKWGWTTPMNLKPAYNRLNLDRIQYYIDIGKINPANVITIKVLVDSGILGGKLKDGIKILGSGSEYFRTPNVRIEVSKVSQTAIQRIESLNGSITSVYHTKLGLQAHVKPSKFAIKPLFEAPILENDIKYYTSKYNNGYLSDADKFDKIFKPRGYVSTVSTGQKEPIVIGNSESQTIYGSVQDVSFNYRIENMDAKLDELRVQREMRSYLFEKCKHVKEECEEEKKKRISGGIFYPGQDNWRWITVSKDKIEALQ